MAPSLSSVCSQDESMEQKDNLFFTSVLNTKEEGKEEENGDLVPRLVRFGELVVSSIVVVPRIDDDQKAELFYNKADFQRFQEAEKRRYEKKMMKEIRKMVREIMSDELAEAKANGATEQELEAMMPQTNEEISALLEMKPVETSPPHRGVSTETIHKSSEQSVEASDAPNMLVSANNESVPTYEVPSSTPGQSMVQEEEPSKDLSEDADETSPVSLPEEADDQLRGLKNKNQDDDELAATDSGHAWHGRRDKPTDRQEPEYTDDDIYAMFGFNQEVEAKKTDDTNGTTCDGNDKPNGAPTCPPSLNEPLQTTSVVSGGAIIEPSLCNRKEPGSDDAIADHIEQEGSTRVNLSRALEPDTMCRDRVSEEGQKATSSRADTLWGQVVEHEVHKKNPVVSCCSSKKSITSSSSSSPTKQQEHPANVDKTKSPSCDSTRQGRSIECSEQVAHPSIPPPPPFSQPDYHEKSPAKRNSKSLKDQTKGESYGVMDLSPECKVNKKNIGSPRTTSPKDSRGTNKKKQQKGRNHHTTSRTDYEVHGSWGSPLLQGTNGRKKCVAKIRKESA